ncbi:sensor histidine kinase [Halarcobacter anaerophilus]|uniref:histidine kinase n=1 Tax=Halarcobacter anaerophilus TaxID=877500 RepID=A0A4Q0XYQ3_9BACT|nr:sensor histidine kinase [Halarcobacter anaerophilus]QDF28013.1 7TMR-DISM-7TM domain-containing two-component system sensor histidine kinase [Halarcobacter anaerophilus]RXJ61449.1 histidine kinase [Halarcobacter anaerophilus]
MKILFTFFILFCSLSAKNYFPEVINGLYISEDLQTFKKLEYKKYLHKKVKQFSIRVDLKKELKETYYFTVVSDVDNLIFTNAEYIKQNRILIIKVDSSTPKSLFFNYKYEKAKIGEFRFSIINEFEHDYLLHYEGILYGIAYGIIFCAFLYYLIIYFSSRKKFFLYYSIMQFFVLLSLIGFVYFSFKSYPNQDFAWAQAIEDIFETSGFLFTLLFAKEVLQAKKIMPKMNLVINFFILLNILDILAILIFKYSILYEYMPFFIGFLIPFLAGLIAVYKGNKYAIIYTLGWFLVCLFVYLAQNHFFAISGIYVIHMIAPLESLIFSFALGLMLKNLVDKQNEKEKLLIHKSKLVSMGEMINNIAHQWRQPLTHLSFINMNCQLSLEDEKIDKEYLSKKLNEANEQIDFMSNTINSFRDFYKPAKEKEFFWISQAVQKAVDIMKPLLGIYSINLEFQVIKDKQIKSYENEYSQVVLNLISNAKDQLKEKEIKDTKIWITVDVKNGKTMTTVCDNAGGIKSKHINKIFEPYFSTKENGSGIGLYMSKTIINSHFKGELIIENKQKGACFTIIV